MLHTTVMVFAPINVKPEGGGQANHRNLIVKSVSRVRILIVPDPHYREIELSAILANTQKAFGGASHVHVEAMAEPNLLLINKY